MNPFLAASLSLFVLFTSCSTYQFRAVDQGRVSRDSVTVSALAIPGRGFEVTVTNATSHAVTVDGAQFRLYGGDKTNWSPLRVIPPTEVYQWAEEDAQRSSTVIIGSESPGYRQTTTTIGGDNGGFTITSVERRPVETTRVYVVRTDNTERLARLKESLFFPITLQPGQSRTGQVYTDSSRKPFLRLVVPVEGSDFEILFERVKVPGPFKNLD